MALKSLSTEDSEFETSIVAEINITPLTDIFLVLLIIFMVTSSMFSQMGVNVNLPAASPATVQSQPEGVIITLLPQGKMKINETEIPTGDYATLEKALKLSFQAIRSRLVILEGDRQTFLGSAIEVMDHARQAGAAQFAIAASLK